MPVYSKAILLISNEPWGDIWYSKHHYAWNLVKNGHSVYFINPAKKWRLKYIFKPPISCNEIESGLCVVNYGNRLPVFKLLAHTLTRWNDVSIEKRIKSLFSLNDPLIWSFDPFRFAFNFTTNKKIYHVVDPYNLMPLDERLARRADLIVMSSKKYLEHYRKFNQNTKIFPHGIPQLDRSINEVFDKTNLPNKYSILVGNIGNDLNFNLLSSLVETSLPLVIVGNVGRLTEDNTLLWKKIVDQPTVFLLPSQPLEVLQRYIKSAVVGLVLYEFAEKLEMQSRSPLKILNYVQSKIPVLSSCHPDINLAINNGIYHAHTFESFLRLYQKAFENGLQIDEKAFEDYAVKYSYPTIIKSIINAIEQ